ncbi:MAG: hypothetical protein Q7V14_04700, partial [Coriobacteriia bacterium]|nr:hypothetical protein [Coriobacteriia bacterium]
MSSDDGQLAYDGHQWNAAMFRLEVFHRGFVDRNVFTGHLVTNAHKQNLCEFVLGGRSVTLSKKIAELGTLALRLSKEIASVKGALQTHVEGSMTIGQFVRLPSVPEIDKQLLQAERDSAAVLKIQELDKRARPVTPPAVAFDADAFRGFLSADLRGISIESMKLVRTHVESVLDKTEGQRWLRYGLAHVVDGLCPYCCQDLSASTIADAYVDFFGDAFRKHLVSLRAQEAAFLQVIGDQAPLQSLRAISEGREKALLWAKECELDEDALANPLQELESRWSEATAVLHAAVVGKMENPVDRFEPTEEIDNAMLELADVLSEYEGARRTVLEAGRSIEARMTALKAMREDEVDQRLSKLRNTKRRHSTT